VFSSLPTPRFPGGRAFRWPILVLAMFFVILNLLVDVAQTSLDPRLQRG